MTMYIGELVAKLTLLILQYFTSSNVSLSFDCCLAQFRFSKVKPPNLKRPSWPLTVPHHILASVFVMVLFCTDFTLSLFPAVLTLVG